MAKKFQSLLDEMPPARRARITADVQALHQALRLGQLREARSFTQEELAESLETSQSGISRIEQRDDVLVSTLRHYVEAIGGELELIARFPDRKVRITQFDER